MGERRGGISCSFPAVLVLTHFAAERGANSHCVAIYGCISEKKNKFAFLSTCT